MVRIGGVTRMGGMAGLGEVVQILKLKDLVWFNIINGVQEITEGRTGIILDNESNS